MQTIRDLVEYLVKETLHYLDKTGNLQSKDAFLEEKIKRKFLTHRDIALVKNKNLVPVKKPSLARVEVKSNLTLQELHLSQIICDIHNISFNDLYSKARNVDIVDARKQLSAFLYIYTCYTFAHVASLFGQDHSTAIHNIKKHEDLLQTNNLYCNKFHRFLETVEREMPELMLKINKKSQQFREYEKLKAQRAMNHSSKLLVNGKTVPSI